MASDAVKRSRRCPFDASTDNSLAQRLRRLGRSRAGPVGVGDGVVGEKAGEAGVVTRGVLLVCGAGAPARTATVIARTRTTARTAIATAKPTRFTSSTVLAKRELA